jgi:hypothetical protein
VAIQEIHDNLNGLRHLKERTEARVAGASEFAIAVSGITGKVPGKTGMAERPAFLYRHRRARRLDLTIKPTRPTGPSVNQRALLPQR